MRAHALLFAAEGASVVVNDLGGGADGSGADATPADEVVAEIRSAGDDVVVVNHDDVADAVGAEHLVAQAIETLGSFGCARQQRRHPARGMVFSMSDEQWDAVIPVHLRGTPC